MMKLLEKNVSRFSERTASMATERTIYNSGIINNTSGYFVYTYIPCDGSIISTRNRDHTEMDELSKFITCSVYRGKWKLLCRRTLKLKI